MSCPDESNAPDEHWETARQWLWKSRLKAPANADIWDLRWRWKTEGPEIWIKVQSRRWNLSPVMLFSGRDGENRAQWSARDALVLKWCALHLDGKLQFHSKCESRRGNGGAVLSVRRIRDEIKHGNYQFVFRTDIRGYYGNIIKSQLWNMVRNYTGSPVMSSLIRQ